MSDQTAILPARMQAARSSWSGWVPTWVYTLLLLIVLLAIWEGYVRLFKVSPFLLPPPSIVVVAWVESLGSSILWMPQEMYVRLPYLRTHCFCFSRSVKRW